MAQDPDQKDDEKQQDSTGSVVLFLTNVNEFETTDKGEPKKQTGWYLPEVAHPYFVFKEAGFKITLASPKGGSPAVDIGSYEQYAGKDKLEDNDAECLQFVNIVRATDETECKNPSDSDKELFSKLNVKEEHKSIKGSITRENPPDKPVIIKMTVDTVPTSAIISSNYDIIFFCGGHGTCWDFVQDPNGKKNRDIDDFHKRAREIYENNGVVAAVCHGPLALVDLKLTNGEYLVKNKKVCGFTNKEEDVMKGVMKFKPLPVLLETGLTNNGANFQAAENWKENVQVDNGVVTGQNPASASKCAKECVAELARLKAQAAAKKD